MGEAAVTSSAMDVDIPAAISSNDDDHAYQEVTFIDTLEEPLRGFAQTALSSSSNTNSATTAALRIDDFEIQLRSHLLTLTQSLLKDPTNDEKSQQIQTYWKSCLNLCLHFVHHANQNTNVDKTTTSPYHALGSAVIRKLPFLLLEDVMETITSNMGKAFWDTTIEPCIEKLCGTDLFVKTSHLVWIRVCNKLVKKQCGGEWAGRILLSVASVFPLSERSGMNVLGSFHIDNVTTYETLDEFQAHEAQEMAKQNNKATPGQHQSSMKMAKTEKEYAFYQTFWGMQKDFSDPNQINFPDFIERMQTILAVLESHAVTSQKTITTSVTEGKGSNETTSPTTTIESESETIAVGHQKYLTNSQLLHLQLKDPELRTHFLTQFLIVETYLSGKQGGTSRFVQHKMTDLVKRAKELLKHTPPHGASHLKTVEWILSERDPMWRNWKKNKCQPDMEKKAIVPPTTESSSSATASGNGTPSNKRRLMDGPLGSSPAAVAKSDPTTLYDFKIDVKKDLPAISKRMGETVPDIYDFLEPYVDALDPEAGIEEEYHPKNDKLFSWRALRLLGRRHLNDFDKVRRSDGDFERLVRHVYKEERDTDIPGDMPEEEPLETQDDINQKIKEEEEKEAARIKAEEEEAARVKAEEEEAARIIAEEEEAALRKAEEEEAARVKAEKEEEAARVKAEEEKEASRAKEDEESAADKSPIPESDGGFDDASVGTPIENNAPKEGSAQDDSNAEPSRSDKQTDSMDVDEDKTKANEEGGGTKRKRDNETQSNGTPPQKSTKTEDASTKQNGNSEKDPPSAAKKHPEKDGDNKVRGGNDGGGRSGAHDRDESSNRDRSAISDKRSPPAGRGSPGRSKHDSYSSRNRHTQSNVHHHKGQGGKGGGYSGGGGGGGNKFEPNHNRRNPQQDRRRSPDRGGGGRGQDNRRNDSGPPQQRDGRGDNRDRNDGGGGRGGGGYRGGGRYDSSRQDNRSGRSNDGGGGRRRHHGGGGGGGGGRRNNY